MWWSSFCCATAPANPMRCAASRPTSPISSGRRKCRRPWHARRELFAQQRATELAKANEAFGDALDALASVPELDDFLGQVMAAITRQLGAVSSTLRVRNFEQNTMALEIVFQDGRVMSPAEAELSRKLAYCGDPDDQRFADFFDQPRPCPACRLILNRHFLESQRSYLLGAGRQDGADDSVEFGGQANGRLTFRFAEERDFHPEELEIARALATQASLAIQLTRLAKTARQSAVLEERNQLAGEIHDSLAQFFTGISMQLGAAKEVLNRGDNQGLSLPGAGSRAGPIWSGGGASLRPSASNPRSPRGRD